MKQEFEALYQEYFPRIYAFLYKLTENRDLAEELTQETFYQAIRTIDRYDGSCRISTWLCAIAKNVLITYRRKHKPHENLEDWDMPVEGGQDEIVRTEEKVELLKKIHTLPDPYREVMYLRVFGELSFREIGDICGKSENWARVTFYRSRQKLLDVV